MKGEDAGKGKFCRKSSEDMPVWRDVLNYSAAV